jgi:hypothetical protein
MVTSLDGVIDTNENYLLKPDTAGWNAGVGLSSIAAMTAMIDRSTG